MDNNLKGKKLLVLGGTALSCEIVKYARKNGLEVYVTDYYEDSPAKKIADRSFLVSTTNIDALTQLVIEEKIDGLLTGFVDLLLPYYVTTCINTNRPCYGTMEQIEVLTDKIKFKEYCRQFDIPVVEDYKTDNCLDDTFINGLNYPILLKPADNSGGRGISICNNSEEFIEKFEKTISFSKSKQVLIERLMQSNEVTIFYILQDGNVKLTAMGDRHIQHFQEGIIPLPIAYTFPSEHLHEYQKSMDEKVVKLFKHLGMKNGMVFIQSFVEDGKCIFYEIGFRLTGSLEYKLIEHACGYNPLDMMIEQAILGKSNVELNKYVNPNFDKYYCNLTFLVKPGVIGKITEETEILSLPNVIDIVYSYNIGDNIPDNALGTLAQVVARVFAYAESKYEISKVIHCICERFHVLSETGESLLLPGCNPDIILKKK